MNMLQIRGVRSRDRHLQEGQPGYVFFVHNRRSSALYVVSTHDGNDAVCTRDISCLHDMVFMTIVKWIVFANDSCCFHKISFRDSLFESFIL